jgi:hypothetical protein
MRLKLIAAAFAFATVVAATPHAFAMSSGSHKGTVTVNPNGTFSGTFDGGTVSGMTSGGKFNGSFMLSAAEPFTTFALGLGLLGARYLRRRQ